MRVDITDLVMQKYHINKLEEEIKRDEKLLLEMENTLRRQCTHPNKYLKPANIAYDMDAKICELCDKVI